MSNLEDPRVLFAAERTLLAWNRTTISLMAFGFVIERFGLFVQFIGRDEIKIFQRQIAFSVGILFIAMGAFLSVYSVIQHKRILNTLQQVEIPLGYNVYLGIITNGAVGIFGVLLIGYLIRGFI